MRFSEDRVEKLTCSDGKQRNIHIWEPEKPRMVFLTVHGLMDHCGNYILPALYFRDHGIASVAYAQQGHDHKGPDHPGKVTISRFEALTKDLELMTEWVKEQFPGLPVFILAHSMGGLVATHFGLKKLTSDAVVKGFILSSPYYANAVKVPQIMLTLAGFLALLVPGMIVPTEDFKAVVTHDEEVYKRQRKDAEDGYVVSSVTTRSGHELLKAQRWVPGNISRWTHPVLFILAGDDRIADNGVNRQMIDRIEPGLVTELHYPENYHENFNELNRDEIFARILEWVEQKE
ncbi:MAG: alpha/beta fold hydrolase [Bacteroidota bacterium]